MKKMLLVAVLVVASGVLYGQITSVGTGNWNTAATWDSNYVPLPGSNVVIASGHIVTLDAAGLVCNDLTISGSLQFSTTVTVDLTVNEDISVLSGGVFRVLANTLGVASPNGGIAHTLNLKGNFTHSGTTVDFRTGSAGTTLAVCNLTLSGTSNSTINVPYASSSNGEFNFLTINKTSSAKVILASDLIEAGGSGTGPAAGNSGISFVSGIVETGIYKLVYQGSTATQVTGGSSTSYVNGSFGRGMSTSGGSSKDFFIGDANGYRPFNLRSTTAGTSTGHLAIVKCVSGNANTGSSSFAGGIDKVSEVRYYQVTYSNAIAGAASMNFDLFKASYGSDDGINASNTDLRVAYSTPAEARSVWTGIAQTTEHSTSISSSPTQITPDAITAITLNSGQSLYVALARVSGTTTNPLPVELQSFSAHSKQAVVVLSWSTATETNNAGFEIERALPLTAGEMGGGQWQKIGFVQGNGTSNTPHSYSFTDASAKGNVSYRLKQIDRDGSFQYSQTVEAAAGLTAGDYSLSQNFPNPFNPSTKISFAVKNAEQVNLSVFNALGQNVATLFNGIAVPNELYTLNFDGKNLASGIYFYSLRSASRNEVKKMLMTK